MANNQQHDERHGETVHSANERERDTERKGQKANEQRRQADPQQSQTGAVHRQQGGQSDDTIQTANERERSKDGSQRHER